MHEPLLSQAAAAAPTVCLGLLLEPYSIGHEVLLFRNESPFISGEREPELKDIITAVVICAHTWTQTQTMHRDWLLAFKVWLWRRRLRQIDLPFEISRFRHYMATGSLEFPESEIPNTDRGPAPRMPGAPFLLRLQHWLMVTLHLKEPAAWDYPLGLAIMRWQAHWEERGGFAIYNYPELVHDGQVKRAQEEAAAKAKAKEAAV